MRARRILSQKLNREGERRVLALRRLPHFRWRAFAFPPIGPNGRLPAFVVLEARDGQREVPIRLGWMGRQVGDSADAPVGENRPRMESVKELGLSDPRVRRILGSVTRVGQAPSVWTGCGDRPIGGITSVELSRPISIDEDLPFVSFQPVQRSHAYAGCRPSRTRRGHAPGHRGRSRETAGDLDRPGRRAHPRTRLQDRPPARAGRAARPRRVPAEQIGLVRDRFDLA
jgi:hypothetical protein